MSDTRLDAVQSGLVPPRLLPPGPLPPGPLQQRWAGWWLKLAGSRRMHGILARMPGLKYLLRAEGRALFDIVAGFVHSQVLLALVELRVLHHLRLGPASAAQLAPDCLLTPDRMQMLLQAGASLGLITRRRDGTFALAARGAAFLAVPGLEAMVRHHRVLYRDLADPVAFLRGQTAPELAQFWPYVFGAAGATDPEVTAHYSGLMADSQALVAEDTLRLIDLSDVRMLMDVGGGTGAFLQAVSLKYNNINMALFDLPAVVHEATACLCGAGLTHRLTVHPGSFRDDPLPGGADAISLVRVLFDHGDATVAALLGAAFSALPPGGLLIVSEPMSGGDRPDRATDSYFAFYTAAMQTGRTRSGSEIGALMRQAGFVDITVLAGFRPFVTSVITARRPR